MARKIPKEDKFIVPGWMVSFSDMIVNLMCFFILLNCYATKQEAGFVGSGTGEYLDAINTEGKPGLMPTHKTLVSYDVKSGRHAAPKIEPLDRENWIKHVRSNIIDEFDRLARSHSKIEQPRRSFPIPLGILFEKGSAQLSAKARNDLAALAPALASRPDTLEVVGACAPDECTDVAKGYELSFNRALAVVHELERAGVPSPRLFPIGVGDAAPDAVGDQNPSVRRMVALRWRLVEG